MASTRERADDIRASVLAALVGHTSLTLDAVRASVRTHVDRLGTAELSSAVFGLERDGRILCDTAGLRLR